jgi:IclR family KDG regulon transcriptional repressor
MSSLSVYKTFEIIEFLSRHQHNIGLRDLARELDMAPSTVHRFISSLKDIGYVKQDPKTSKYRLSLKFAWLGSKVLGSIQVAELAKPFMEELTSNTNETTHLGVLDGLELVYVAKIDGNQAINMTSRVGHRGALFSTAIGKVLLAFMSDEERIEILDQMVIRPRTDKTITNTDELLKQLGIVRREGFAIDDEENETGIRCIGAPIFNHQGVVVAALSLSGWKVTMTSERMSTLPRELMITTRKISEELGYAG